MTGFYFNATVRYPQLNLVLLLLLTIDCAMSQALFQTENNSLLQVSREGAYCGEMKVNVRYDSIVYEIGIFENKKYSDFIYDRIHQNIGAMVNANGTLNETCVIQVCGFSLGTYTPEKGECHLFSKPEWRPVVPAYGQTKFDISSISCGCDKQRLNCGLDKCSTKKIAVPPQDEDEVCGVLYQETKCQECFYDGIILYTNGSHKTQHSTAIKSLYVIPGCVVTQTNYGYLTKTFPDIQRFKYANSDESIPLSYHRAGEEFYCECFPPTESPFSITVPNPKTAAIIGGAGGSVALIVFIIGTIIILKIRSSRRPTIVLTHEEVQEILDGDKEADENAHDDNADACNNVEYLPNYDVETGCTNALRLPYSPEFEINRKRLDWDPKNPDSKIGSGNFGQVYKGKLHTTTTDGVTVSRDVAIKTLNPLSQTKENLKSLINEIKVISYIGFHPNIVEFIGACTVNLKRGEVFSVMELCYSGSLKKHLQIQQEKIKNPSQIILNINTSTKVEGYCQIDKTVETSYFKGEDQGSIKRIESEIGLPFFMDMLKWSRDIASGMDYLCKRNVLHIDLATRNILLSVDLTAKICDFGLSRKLYDRNEYDKTGKDPVPFKWIALECMTENKYSAKSDVWAYAVTLWEIFNLGRVPYADKKVNEIFNFLQSGNRLSTPSFATSEIYALMLQCWDKNPDLRPEFADATKFFQELLYCGAETEPV